MKTNNETIKKEFEEKFVCKQDGVEDYIPNAVQLWNFFETKLNEIREEVIKDFCEYLLRKNDGRLLRVIENMHYTDLMKKADEYLTTKEGKE